MAKADTTIRILRSDPEGGSAPEFATFAVVSEAGMTVLSALQWIQDNLDGTVAFRYSCRGAVCGSCAMVINGQVGLACRNHLADLPREIVLEPLPNLPILKDLVVDMSSFWEALDSVSPYLIGAEETSGKENLQSPADRERIEQFINCVQCASCYASCPVRRNNPEFIGPAALAALDRFVDDSRDRRGKDALKSVNSDNGLWGCRMALECIDACPKNVRPADGVAKLRVKSLARLLGRKKR